MTPTLNVVRIYAAMKAKGWGRKNTCANCGMANETLNKILDGKIPRRIDTLFRLCDGLQISMRELFIFPRPNHTKTKITWKCAEIRRVCRSASTHVTCKAEATVLEFVKLFYKTAKPMEAAEWLISLKKLRSGEAGRDCQFPDPLGWNK